MGIIRIWRGLRTLKAVSAAANEAERHNAPGSATPPGGAIDGFMNVLAELMATRMGATGPRRGGPLPGSDAAVVDGSAWAVPVAVGAAAVRARDRAFDPALLGEFAGQVFAAMAAVWQGADAGSVRLVLSDPLWQPLAALTGVAGAKRTTPASPLQAPQHASARVAGLHAGPWYDSALVIMSVSVDLGDFDFGGHAPPAGIPAELRGWDEEWLFQRSVRPGGDPMIAPLACPSCGASAGADADDLCLHCRAPVPYLTSGWLATEVVSHNAYLSRIPDNFRSAPQMMAEYRKRRAEAADRREQS